ncbi:MAG: metal ABC transporter substrate-binding protein [Candidatus Manganitrophaceae bacterium]
MVTTTEDLAAIAKEVGGDRVQVESLAKGTQDPHFLEAKPSLILKLSRADLFVQVGLDLEAGWVPALLVGARNGKIQRGEPGFVDASIGITLLEVPTGRIDRSAGDIHLQGNPHFWLDPMNGKQIARNIGEGLKRVDPERAPFYDRNIADFSRRLDEAAARWEEKMKPFAGTKVITYHKSWPYFLKRFGLTATGYIEPKPGIPPSASHLNDLIALIKQEQVKVILMEPYFSDQAPKFVAEKSGAKVIVLPPSVSIATGMKDYFQLFDSLVDTLAEALR